MVHPTRRISPESGLTVDPAMHCARLVRAAWSGASPRPPPPEQASRLGRMTLRLSSAGESHGPALVAIVSGLPAGLTLDRDAIDADLKRRQEGYGRSPRQQIEQDRV